MPLLAAMHLPSGNVATICVEFSDGGEKATVEVSYAMPPSDADSEEMNSLVDLAVKAGFRRPKP